MRFRDFARWTLSRFGFATNQRMIAFLNTVLKVRTFEELRIRWLSRPQIFRQERVSFFGVAG